MTPEQQAHMKGAREACNRAGVWADKAHTLNLLVLESFWKEVKHMLETGIDMQERAMSSIALMNQNTKIYLEKTTGRLFKDEQESFGDIADSKSEPPGE